MLRSFRAVALAGLACTTAIAAAAPASAATFYLNVDPVAGSTFFGDSSAKKGDFSDIFLFKVPKGIVSAFVGSIALKPSLDVLLSSVTFDGKPFAKQSTGALELWTLDDTSIGAGTHDINVSGKWGSKGGSYAGTVNFTAGVPEPANWAMMIAGFGMIGGAMRSRRSKTSVSFA